MNIWDSSIWGGCYGDHCCPYYLRTYHAHDKFPVRKWGQCLLLGVQLTLTIGRKSENCSIDLHMGGSSKYAEYKHDNFLLINYEWYIWSQCMPRPSAYIYRLCLRKQSNIQYIPFPFLWCFKLDSVGIFPLHTHTKLYFDVVRALTAD